MLTRFLSLQSSTMSNYTRAGNSYFFKRKFRRCTCAADFLIHVRLLTNRRTEPSHGKQGFVTPVTRNIRANDRANSLTARTNTLTNETPEDSVNFEWNLSLDRRKQEKRENHYIKYSKKVIIWRWICDVSLIELILSIINEAQVSSIFKYSMLELRR